MLHASGLFWHVKFLIEEDAPSKVARVDIPSTPIGGGVPGSLGIAYPPQPALGTMRPM